MRLKIALIIAVIVATPAIAQQSTIGDAEQSNYDKQAKAVMDQMLAREIERGHEQQRQLHAVRKSRERSMEMSAQDEIAGYNAAVAAEGDGSSIYDTDDYKAVADDSIRNRSFYKGVQRYQRDQIAKRERIALSWRIILSIIALIVTLLAAVRLLPIVAVRIRKMRASTSSPAIMKRRLVPGYSAADELQKWRRLKDEGTITEDEFQAARASILGSK